MDPDTYQSFETLVLGITAVSARGRGKNCSNLDLNAQLGVTQAKRLTLRLKVRGSDVVTRFETDRELLKISDKRS